MNTLQQDNDEEVQQFNHRIQNNDQQNNEVQSDDLQALGLLPSQEVEEEQKRINKYVQDLRRKQYENDFEHMGPLKVLGRINIFGNTYNITPCKLFQFLFGIFIKMQMIFLGSLILFMVFYIVSASFTEQKKAHH